MASNEIEEFQVFSDNCNVGLRWSKWLRQFQLLMEEKDITTPNRLRAALLRRAGEQVQDIAITLEEQNPLPAPVEGQVELNAYQRLLDLLNAHFLPQRNEHYERQVMKSMVSKTGENSDSFLMRLRVQAKLCSFGVRENEEIRDAFIDKCPFPDLKAKLLNKLLSQGENLTLQAVADKARLYERVKTQMEFRDETPAVNKVRTNSSVNNSDWNKKDRFKEFECFACGRKGHFRNDPNCPAKKQKCAKCGYIGHFAKFCLTKKGKRKSYVNETTEITSDSDQSDPNQDVPKAMYSFVVNSLGIDKADLYPIKVGGVDIDVLIDSGANCNVIGNELWSDLKRKRITCIKQEKVTKVLHIFGSKGQLETIGRFRASVQSSSGKEGEADFLVLKGEGTAILGRPTSLLLDVLKVATFEPVVNAVSTAEQMKSDKMEIEMLEARVHRSSEVNGNLSEDEDVEVSSSIYRQKYERAMRELDILKRRFQQQHEEDQFTVKKKAADKRLAEALEEIEEVKQAADQWKRKAQKLNLQLQDLSLMLEEQMARNGELEKKQRCFDTELNYSQEEIKKKRIVKGKAIRERDLAEQGKYSLEQDLHHSKRLHVDLQYEKITQFNRESDELSLSSNGEIECQNRTIVKRLRIAHADGKNLKKELDVLLAAYRTTPHSITGVPPGTLLFGRQIRSKLPEIHLQPLLDEELRDRDKFKKHQSKIYSDQRRHARAGDNIQPGDSVLMKQARENKLSTLFKNQQMEVLERNNSEVTVRDPEDGGIYKRNVSCFKKYIDPSNSSHVSPASDGKEILPEGNSSVSISPSKLTPSEDATSQDADRTAQRKKAVIPSAPPCESSSRPRRERKPPSRFKDFSMN